jgi:hypothetical protein
MGLKLCHIAKKVYRAKTKNKTKCPIGPKSELLTQGC